MFFVICHVLGLLYAELARTNVPSATATERVAANTSACTPPPAKKFCSLFTHTTVLVANRHRHVVLPSLRSNSLTTICILSTKLASTQTSSHWSSCLLVQNMNLRSRCSAAYSARQQLLLQWSKSFDRAE